MKKTITCLCSLLLSSFASFAQVTVDNFENGNRGWVTVTGMGYLDVRANDYKTGLNLSDYVLYTQRAVGEDNWAGAIFSPCVHTGYKYLHAYMYRSNAGTPNLKVSDANPQDLKPMNATVAGQWQDIVFDISAYETSGIEFLMFMVDRADNTELVWMLVDEIQLSNDPAPRTETVTKPDPQPAQDGYTLVWNADFVQDALDGNAWNIEVNGDGGGNQELQYYCEKGVSLGVEPTTGKHCLILTATKENYMGKTCTSGRVNSLGKVYFQYGKVEARIFFPNTANGLWPAFWMMGNDFAEVGWPACGETDIVELGHQNGIKAGTQERFFNGASHWGPQWDQHYQYAQDITNAYSVQDGFHTFTCIWDAERVAMYVDLDKNPNAVPYYQMTIPKTNEDNAPGKYFHKPNFIIFNLAVGGMFPAIYDINDVTALRNGPKSMYVDYVRVYQKGDAGETFSAAVASDPIEQAGTALINPGAEQTRARKVLRDGQLLIEADGQYYNLWGQQVNIK